jgi:hypothetical protein
MKINFGGAYSSRKSGAVGIEARDHYGAVCVAKSRYFPFALDAQTVEAFALKDAVTLASKFQQPVLVEGDAKFLVEAVRLVQKHFMCTMEDPDSIYSSLDIHICNRTHHEKLNMKLHHAFITPMNFAED